MKLSMHMLAWYLKGLEPVCSIVDDDLSIRGVRFLSEESQSPSFDYIYFGETRFYFSEKYHEYTYIVVHKRNYLLFGNVNFEELLNGLLSSFDFFNDWERRMIEITSGHGSMQDILDTAREILDNPAVVGDVYGNFYAASDIYQPLNDPYWDYLMQNHKLHPSIAKLQFNDMENNPIYELTKEPRLVKNVYEKGWPVLMMYLFQDGQAVACYSILQTHTEFEELNLQLAPIIASYLSLCSEFTSSRPLIQSDEAIFRSFLSGTAEDDQYGKTAAERIQRYDLSDKWRLIILRQTIAGNYIQKSMMINRMKESALFILPVLIDDEIYALISEEGSFLLPFSLPGGIAFEKVSIGLSMVCTDLFSLPNCVRQAHFALDKARGKDGVFLCEDYAFSYLIENFRNMEMTSALIHPAVAVLEGYDKKKNSVLYETLSAYLECDRSIEETSRHMNVHKSTLKYRLKRIQEISGIDFDDIKDMNYLRLSCWLTG